MLFPWEPFLQQRRENVWIVSERNELFADGVGGGTGSGLPVLRPGSCGSGRYQRPGADHGPAYSVVTDRVSVVLEVLGLLNPEVEVLDVRCTVSETVVGSGLTTVVLLHAANGRIGKMRRSLKGIFFMRVFWKDGAVLVKSDGFTLAYGQKDSIG